MKAKVNRKFEILKKVSQALKVKAENIQSDMNI